MTTRRKSKKPGQAHVAAATGPDHAAASRARARPLGRDPPEGTGPGDLQQAHRRLQRLYEISELLARFESAETTVPAVIALLGATLPLRSAILILETEGRNARSIVLRGEGVSADRLQAAKARAQNSYAYLSGSAASALVFLNDDDAANYASAGEAAETVDRKSFIMLPLAIERRPID